ncbi:hypothetical protein ACIBL3_42630, partial [Kribbella sp. NPDC050124]
DTASLQRRRADAVGIIADPRYTEELLHQAHQLLANTPAAAPSTAGTATSQATAPPPATDTNQGTIPTATGPAPAPARNTIGPVDQGTTSATAQALGASTGRGAAPTAAPATDQRQASTTGPGSEPAAGPVIDGEPTAADLPPAPTGASPSVSAAASARTADRGGPGRWDRSEDGCDGWPGDGDLLGDWGEPGPEDEADRDAPYPGDSELPDPLDAPYSEAIEPFEPGLRLDDTDGEPMDAAARRVLQARLAQIRRDAHTDPGSGRVARPGQTEVYVHLTDHTLATGTGVLRAETIGPLLATQLAELIGHSPYTVKPVIDLNDAVSVDAYEIPDRIRERTRLTHPVELFPYGSRETHPAMDLDHIQPYDPLGPPGQTSTSNLVPLRRFPHRIKTHGRWQVRRLDPRTLEWTTPNGFTFHVDPTGTHRAPTN